MIRFELDPFADPFQDSGDAATASPGPDPLTEHEQLVTACAARPGGHRWLLVGEPEEAPYLSCEDCPGGTDDAYPELSLLLHGLTDIGKAYTVDFSEPLSADAEPYSIPVNVAVEEIRRWTDYGTEYDAEVHITDREVTP
ncbi:hypothetical protein ACQEVF_25070 [Nonomuraea polychroma]|uniref:hypothetical protein n=1 Tax=Nonomuraea polychroma TaxID=46176 RepID=UPI003D8C6389